MATQSGTFTAVQQTTLRHYLRPTEVVRVTLTVTGSASIVLHENVGPGMAFTPVDRPYTATGTYDFKNLTANAMHLQLIVTAIAGSVAYTMADIAGDQILLERYAADGTLVFRVTDEGVVVGVGAGVDARSFGATGDGVHYDVDAINRGIEALAADGGGRLYLPPTDAYYRIGDNIRLLDNVELCGAGYASRIHSDATTGYTRNPIVTGNIGDITGGGGFYNNTQYDLLAITAGSDRVTFVTLGDAATFTTGDVVAIQSDEEWALSAPDDHGKYINLNEVVSKSGATLYLKYPIPDAYASSGGNRPTIARLDGTGTSYDGDTEWVSKNCIIRDLRITQSIGGPSYWYGIFLDGIGHLVENVWMDDVSTMLGSNALAHSIVRNVRGRFDGGVMDFADFQCNNLIENIVAQRVGRRGNIIGFAVNNGADVTVRNLWANMGWYDADATTFYKSGRASAYLVHRALYENSTIINADGTSGSACGLLAGFGDDVTVRNCHVKNASGNGILLAGGPRTRILDNTVLGTPAGSFNAIIALTAADEYVVRGNVLGEEGSRTTVDTVAQSGGFSVNAVIADNIQYGVGGSASTGSVVDAGYVETASTSFVTLKTYTIGADTTNKRGWRFSAAGERTGTTDTKSLRIVLDLGGLAQTVIDAVYTAPGTTGWAMTALIIIDPALDLTRTSGTSIIATVTKSAYATVASEFGSGTTVVLQGLVANAADRVTVNEWIVEPL